MPPAIPADLWPVAPRTADGRTWKAGDPWTWPDAIAHVERLRAADEWATANDVELFPSFGPSPRRWVWNDARGCLERNL